MEVETLTILLILLVGGSGLVGGRAYAKHLFDKHWSSLGKRYNLSYTPSPWKKVLTSNEWGQLCGEWEGTPLRLQVHHHKLTLFVDGQGKLPQDQSLQASNKGIISLVTHLIAPPQSTIQTGDKSFDRSFPLRGDRATALALFHTPVRTLMKQLMGKELTLGNEITTLSLQDGVLVYEINDKGSIQPNPRLSPDRCEQWMASFADCCALVRQLSLPPTLEEQSTMLAKRLCEEIFQNENKTQQVKLATILIEDFPEHLEALDAIDRMAQSSVPGLRWFALEYLGQNDTTTVYNAAIDEAEDVDVRLHAFAWLAQHAPPHMLFQMYLHCESSPLAAIRKEAKKRRKELQAAVQTLQGGRLSLDEDSGQLSITSAGGELSSSDESS